MLKPYNELRKIDITQFCERREARDEQGKKIEVPYLHPDLETSVSVALRICERLVHHK